MRRNGHRPDARSAPTVRDAERLVQVEVRDIATETAGLGKTEERVEVGSVDVDLAAVLVHEGAHVADALFVHAVGRGVGDHDRRQGVSMLLTFRAEVIEVDRPVVPAGNHRHPHTGHDGRSGVRCHARSRG